MLSITIAIVLTAIASLLISTAFFGSISWQSVLCSIILFLPALIILFSILYLLLNKLLPANFMYSNKINEVERKNLNPDIITYKLSKGYIVIGILVVFACLIGVFLMRDELSIIFLILIITHLATNPYRVDLVKGNLLVVHRVFRKKEIDILKISRVFKGYYRDKFEIENDYIFLNHVISNISDLTDLIAEKINTKPFAQGNLKVKLIERKQSSLAFTVLLIIVITILYSVFAVFYLKEFVKTL